ncbi:hypothetical protein MJL30_38905, partial [Salmonella enterica subsp. enterica serovar Anatum]|nr:hypothetical protein [Salmonella enterica subsp. enterica serovar Anatum]
KVYEMKGENRLAADAYLTAFNLRPGENTLYWIENGVFQTSVQHRHPHPGKDSAVLPQRPRSAI